MTDQMLAELVRRESRSFLQYVREAFPWAKNSAAGVRDAVLKIANEEAAHVAKVGRLLQRRHIPLPGLGAYPTAFTNFNFVSAAYMLPKITAAERQGLADLERDLFRVTDDEMRTTLEAYRDLKRQHLTELESLAGTN